MILKQIGIKTLKFYDISDLFDITLGLFTLTTHSQKFLDTFVESSIEDFNNKLITNESEIQFKLFHAFYPVIIADVLCTDSTSKIHSFMI